MSRDQSPGTSSCTHQTEFTEGGEKGGWGLLLVSLRLLPVRRPLPVDNEAVFTDLPSGLGKVWNSCSLSPPYPTLVRGAGQ